MAHNCPVCDCLCHCKGDIDDLNFGQEPRGGCIHYKYPSCEQDWDDDDFYDYDDDADEGFEDDDEKLIPQKDGGLHDPKNNITHYP
jgi:hypothetical protein